jgi:solute carrier family 13 (sodium-dependent dicarboxylate transporter), member 2/3/5
MTPSAPRTSWQWAGLILGPLVALILAFFFQPDPSNPKIGYMAAVVALMAIWWITEAVPLAATSLLPFLLFPPLAILEPNRVASSYLNSIIFLFLGGFLIALAMERWNLHRRIALAIISKAGSRPSATVLGFMLAAAFLSMWISNTATAVMMLPIGLAILSKVEEVFGEERSHTFALCLMLGIAYGCSIGGVATLVGTPPNMVLAGVYGKEFPDHLPISFGNWMLVALPFAAAMLAATWFLLTRVLCRVDPGLVLDRNTVQQEREALGPMGQAEKTVAVVFVTTALLWIFRSDLRLGVVTLPGWRSIAEPLQALDDGSVAIGMALLLFILPAKAAANSPAILDGKVFSRVPWGIILLFGGGFALADGFGASGLSRYLASAFTAEESLPPLAMIGVISFGVTFLTELTSNTATTQMLLPLLAAAAVGMDMHPLYLMIPATLSASMAFMMPVATPPNAIVFSSQRIRIREMVRVGLALNFVGLILIVAASYFLVPLVFGFG